MKKVLALMMLLYSINSHCFAQASPNPEKIFETQRNPYRRSFFFDLGKKERMQVEVYDLDDLAYLQNIDSIIEMFIGNLESVKDSIPASMYSRLVEYTIDGPNMKRLSFSKHGPEKTDFVFTDGEVSLLKEEQDTIVIVGAIPGQYTRTFLQKQSQPRHYRISLFLNDLDRLAKYRGHLNRRLQTLYTSVNGKWGLRRDGLMYLRSSPDISSVSKRGYVQGGDIIMARPSIDIQNYKSLFIPSFTAGFVFATNKNLVHREYYIAKESHFIFNKMTMGKLKPI